MWPFRSRRLQAPVAAPAQEWRALPPVQRVVAPIDGVVSTSAFAANLASHRNEYFLAPLTHLTASDAHKRALQGITTLAPPAIRPSTRPPVVSRRFAPRPSGTSAGPTVPPHEEATGNGGRTTPQRRLPVAEASHPEIRLTTAPPPDLPSRSLSAEPVVSFQHADESDRLPSPYGIAGPVEQAVAPSTVDLAPNEAAVTTTSAPSTGAPTLGPPDPRPRRLGLGPPLHAIPNHQAAPGPSATQRTPTVQRRSAGTDRQERAADGPELPTARVDTTPRDDGAEEPLLHERPISVVSGSTSTPSAPVQTSPVSAKRPAVTKRSDDIPRPSGAESSVDRPAVAALLGDRPIASVMNQEAPAGRPQGERSGSQAARTPISPSTTNWTPSGSDLQVLASWPSTGRHRSVPVQRRPSDGTPASTSPARHPVLQALTRARRSELLPLAGKPSRAAGAGNAADLAPVWSAEENLLHATAGPDPGAVAVAAGIAQRAADGAVAFESPSAASDAPTSPGSAPQAVFAPAAAPAAAAPAAAARAAVTEKDLDQLVKRLYPRLRERLKAEIRLDRERLGRVTDVGLRH